MAYKTALQTLKGEPQNQESNRIVGEYLFILRDHRDGLAFLRKGDDAPLKTIAVGELQPPTDTMKQVLLGDAWVSVARRWKGQIRNKAIDKARTWYETARSTATGLEKLRVNARLKALDDMLDAVPKPKR